MTEATHLSRAPGVGRLGDAAAWISAACCLPYLFLKLVWTRDVPVGISDRSMLHRSGWVAGPLLARPTGDVGAARKIRLGSTWLGSVALAAFDGLGLLLLVIFRPNASEGGWSVTDSVVAIKVAIGVFAAGVGVLAITAAANDIEAGSPGDDAEHAHADHRRSPVPRARNAQR